MPPSPAEEGRFALDMRECARVPEEDVRRVLHIEVGALLLPARTAAPQDKDGLLLTIRCARSVAWIEATGATVTTPLAERLFLDELPADAAPRALALAGLELLAATDQRVRARLGEARSSPEPAPDGARPLAPAASIESRGSRIVSPPAPSPSLVAGDSSPRGRAETDEALVPAATPVPAESRALEDHRAPSETPALAGTPSLALGAAWRAFGGAKGISAPGAWVGLAWPARGPWVVRVDGELLRTRRDFAELGHLGAWLGSLAASVGGEVRRGPLAGSLSVGWRQGLVRWSGDSEVPPLVESATAWRAWGGPLVALQAHWRSGRLGATLGVEGGRSLWDAEALAFGAPALAVRGFWMALWLGAEVGL